MTIVMQGMIVIHGILGSFHARMYSSITIGKKSTIEPHCASPSEERSWMSRSNHSPLYGARPKALCTWPPPMDSATPTVKPSKTAFGIKSIYRCRFRAETPKQMIALNRESHGMMPSPYFSTSLASVPASAPAGPVQSDEPGGKPFFGVGAEEKQQRLGWAGAAATTVSASPIAPGANDVPPALPANPRRHIIGVLCFCSVFGTDIYMRMPSNFYTVEAGVRGATQLSVSGYLAAFPVGGLLTCFVAPMLLRAAPPNRLNRLSQAGQHVDQYAKFHSN